MIYDPWNLSVTFARSVTVTRHHDGLSEETLLF